MSRRLGSFHEVAVGRHYTLSLKPGKSGFVRHTDRESVLSKLREAKSDPDGMSRLRYALAMPLSHMSDEDVLQMVATDIGHGRMVLTNDFLDVPGKQSVTAYGKGKTTTINRADGSSEVRTGNRPWRNYNPGDIEIFPHEKDPFAMRHGAVGKEGGFAIFPDEKTGFTALTALLQTDTYQSRTIEETMKRFAPASDHNDPVGYAASLSSAVGAPVTTRLSALSSIQLTKLVNKIAQVEGYYTSGSVRINSAKARR